MKRRDAIRTALLTGAAGLMPGATAAAGLTPAQSRRQARNIIFFAYDGMTWEDVALAQWHSRRVHGRPLTLQRLLAQHGGSMETYSLTSVVTDSSAASSAWSTGRKIVNGMMNLYPDDTPLTTILDIARAQGRATGLVTTTRITHATPAAWIARVRNREEEDSIAEQYLAFGPDVLLGGGARHFLATTRDDGRDLFADYAAGGYAVVRSADELARSNASRVLGVFSDDHMPFELDRTRQDAGGPSLATMAEHALGVLSGSERGFVLQIEAGRVDHANHKNDMATSLHDMMAADEALAVAMRYVDAHPDTLLLVASDHATGGGVVYGVGTFYRNSTNALQRIEAHDASFDHIVAQFERTGTRGEIIEVVRAHTGVELLPNQAEIVERAMRDGIRASIHMAYNDQPHNSLAHVLYGGAGGRLPQRLNVNFSTGQHSAGVVPVAAYGAGADTLALDMIDNTALFDWMLAALGTSHRNPVMTGEEAAAALQRAFVPGREGAGRLAYGVHS